MPLTIKTRLMSVRDPVTGEYKDIDAVGGGVSSVNGKTGVVNLDGRDINVDSSAQSPETVKQALTDINSALSDLDAGNIPVDRTAQNPETVAEALSDVSRAINTYVGNLVNDFSWIENKTYSTSTGNLIVTNTWFASNKVIGNDFTKQFNYEAIAGTTNTSVIALWNNGVYVGYYYRGAYKNPSNETISKPTYYEWGVSASTSNHVTFHMYTVAYSNQILEIQSELNQLDDITEQLKNEFGWEAGYYHFQTGEKTGASSSYHRSNINYGNQYEFADPAVFNGSASNFISFWYQGTYAGYYLDGKYYNPSQTQVESVTYDQWAVNIYTNNYAQLKPNSLENRVEKLENNPSDSRYDHLYGKKIGFLGDSITNGVGCSDYDTTKAKCYVSLMKTEFGNANVTNYGINGSLIASSTSAQVDANSMAVRYANMSNDLDIVVVFGGTNDWYYGTAWGTVDSTDTDTFLGALNVLMSGLVEKYCGKEIFFVTPMSSAYSGENTDNPNPDTGKTMLDYRNAIIERAAYHAIPVIDLYSMCGMDVAHNAANKAYYSSDGVHPNDAGHKRVHDRIVTFISNIIY